AGAGAPLDPSSLALVSGSLSVALAATPAAPLTFDVPRDAGLGLEGPREFDLRAADVAGNAGDAGVVIYFDDLGPRVGAITAADGGAWVARTAAAPVLVAAADDGSGMASVQAFNAAGTVALSAAATSGSAGRFALAVDSTAFSAG